MLHGVNVVSGDDSAVSNTPKKEVLVANVLGIISGIVMIGGNSGNGFHSKSTPHHVLGVTSKKSTCDCTEGVGGTDDRKIARKING